MEIFDTTNTAGNNVRRNTFATYAVGGDKIPARHPRITPAEEYIPPHSTDSVHSVQTVNRIERPSLIMRLFRVFKKRNRDINGQSPVPVQTPLHNEQLRNKQSIAPKHKIKPRRSFRRRFAIYSSIIFGFLVIFFIAFGVFRISSISGDIFSGSEDKGPGFFEQLTAFVKPSAELKGEDEGQVNVLLIGVGGEGHPGGTLADTIMVASLRPLTGEVALLSIPRDLFIPTTYSKINAVHAYAEQQAAGSGPGALTDVVEEITGLTIPYYVRVDFQAFSNAIDHMGGVTVNVPNAFYDQLHDVNFQTGPQVMSGGRALIYVRARYISGSEGSDFARAARAQIVIEALRARLLELNIITDIDKISGMLKDFGTHVRTNFTPSEMKRVYEITRTISTNNIVNKVLDNASTKLLFSDSVQMGGIAAYVLRPVGGNWSKIQEFVANIFTRDWLVEEKPTVDVLNGTNQVGLGGNIGKLIADQGFTIKQIQNAQSKEHLATYIIDRTNGKKSHTLSMLVSFLEKNASVIIETKTTDTESAGYTSDFIVVLGANYLSTP